MAGLIFLVATSVSDGGAQPRMLPRHRYCWHSKLTTCLVARWLWLWRTSDPAGFRQRPPAQANVSLRQLVPRRCTPAIVLALAVATSAHRFPRGRVARRQLLDCHLARRNRGSCGSVVATPAASATTRTTRCPSVGPWGIEEGFRDRESTRTTGIPDRLCSGHWLHADVPRRPAAAPCDRQVPGSTDK